MTGWLELSANKLRQSYVQGFIDISGGGLYLRNDLSINFYDNTGSNIPKFSIKSDSLRIPDDFGDYYDLSTSQLLYLKDISQNIQTQLTGLVSKTKYITSDATNIDTLIKLDGTSKNITVHGNILPASAYGYDLGSATLPFGSLFLKNSTIHLIDASSDEVTASISYDSSSGSLYLSTADYTAPLNNTQYVNGVLQTPVLSYDGNVGIGITNPSSTLDISGTVNVTGDASFNGNVLVNSGNVIISGSLVIGDTIYEKGIPLSTKYLTASDPVVTGNSTLEAVLIKQSLVVQGDSSLNGRLFVGKDASMNANLYVAGNLITATPSTTDSSTLVATTAFVKNQGYATLASPAFTGTATMVNGNISQKLFVTGDVSMNSKLYVYNAATFYSRLYVSNDAFLSARLIVTGDASFSGNMLAPTQSITDNSTKVATTAYVKNQGYATLSGGYFLGDVSFGSRLFILGDVSMSNSLYIGGDVSVNGNLIAVTQSISDTSTRVATTAYVKNQGYATLASPVFTGTATLQSVSISQALLVSADSTFIGNLNVNGNLTTNTQFNSDNSTKVATTQFVKNQGYAMLSSPTFTGSVNLPTLSASKNIFVTGDVSLNSRLYVAGDVSLNGNVNIDGILTTITQSSNDNSLKVATTEFVKNQGYAALTGANFIGDISLNTRLFVGGDASLNSNLTVSKTTTLLGNTYAVTPNTGDNSTKVATTEYVKNQEYATLASPEFTGVPIAPTPAYGDNSTQIATTEYVTTQLYSFINSNQEVYTALQSLSSALNETDASFATTLASSLGLKADKASPVFTGTVTLPILNAQTNIFSLGDVSFNGKLFVSGDISTNGNVSAPTPLISDNSTKMATTAFVKNQGYAQLSGANFTGNLVASNQLTVSGNTILNNYLSVLKDTTLNGNLSLAGQATVADIVTLLSRLIVGGDVSMNGNLSVNGTTNFPTPETNDISTKVATTEFVKNQGYAKLSGANFTGDVSMNSKLFISSDVSMNSKLFIGSDVSMNSNLFVSGVTTLNDKLSIIGDVSMNSNLMVGKTIYENGTALINKYATLASPTFTGDVSGITKTMVGLSNIDNTSDINKPISTLQQTALNLKSNIESPSFTGTLTAPVINISNKLLISGDASLNARLYVSSDVSMNGNLSVGGSIMVPSPSITDNSNKVATTAYVQSQGFVSSTGGNFTGDVSFNNNMTIGGDLSLNGRLFVGGDASVNANLSILGKTILYDDLSLNGHLSVEKDVSFNSKVSIMGDVSLNGNMKINGILKVPTPLNSDNSTTVATTAYVQNQGFSLLSGANFTGDVSMNKSLIVIGDTSLNSNLFVSGDLSLNNRLLLGGDSTLNGNVYIQGKSTLIGDVSMNTHLSIGKDVSMNGNLLVKGDLSLNGSLNVAGIFNASTQNTSDNSTKVATTAFVKNQGYATTSSPIFTGTATTASLIVSDNLISNADAYMQNDLIVNNDTRIGGNVSVTGYITSSTPSTSENSTTVATTAFVKSQPFAPIASPIFSGRVIATNIDISSNLVVIGDSSMNGNMSIAGTITTITPSTTDNSTTVATTAYVKSQPFAPIESPTFTGTVIATNLDVSSNLVMGGDISMNGNLNVGGKIYESGVSLVNKYATLASPTFTGTVSGITKSMIDLSNVDNTSDINKPVSTAQQTALNLKANITSPTFTGTVIATNIDISSNLSVVGDASMNGNLNIGGKIYESGVLLVNKYATLASPTFTGTVSGITKSMVDLSNVDNTSDINKPVSTAQQTALNLKANIASPTFTGTVKATSIDISSNLSVVGDASLNGNLNIDGIITTNTPSVSDSSTKVATTAYVQNQSYAKLSGGYFTGDVSMSSNLNISGNLTVSGTTSVVTPISSDNSTKIATTAYVQSQNFASLTSPIFTGVPTAPTMTITDPTSTQIATTKYVENKIIDYFNTASTETLNAINQLSAALSGSDASFASTLATQLAVKADIANPIFTGVVTIPTAKVTGNFNTLGDSSMNGNISIGGIIYEGGTALVSKYATLESPTFTGTVGGITKSMITGLSNVDNTADIYKPVSTAQQTALNLKANIASPTLTGKTTMTSTDISTNLYVGGDASMNGNLKVFGNLYENGTLLSSTYATLASPIFTGIVSGITKSMVDLSNVDNTSDINKPVSSAQQTALNLKANIASPSFTGSAQIAQGLYVGSDASINGNIYENGKLLSLTYATLASPTFTGTVSGITKSMVDLSNVDNTSDINKPVSTAQQTALNLKANIASPSFTGSAQIAQSLYVGSDISLNGRLYVSSDVSINGTITTITPVTSDNSNKVATTAYVKSQNSAYASLTGATFTGDISINTKLFVGSDVSLNGRLFVGSDLSVNGNIRGNFPSNSIPLAAIIGGLGTNVDLSSNQTVYGIKTFANDVSMSGRLFLTGNMVAVGNNIVSNVYQSAVDPSVNTISNLLKITDNSYGTYINDLEISKSNGLMIAYNTTGGRPVLTRDGGSTWSTVSTTGTNTSYNAMLCISPYGRIILKQEYNTSTSTPSLYISTDWGVTYTAITLAQSIIYTNAYYGYNTYNNQSYAFSQDGNVLYFLARDTNNTIALWKNGDASFNSFTKQGSWNYTLTNCPRAIATSGNGQYVLAITGINNANSMFLYQSSNYGVTFTKTINSLSSNWNSIAVSYNGQYQTAIDNNKVYQSSDYGINWSVSSSAPTAKWNFISMSNNGKNRVACIDSSYQYITLDYGSTWSVVPNSFGNWKKAVMTDISNDNSIVIFSHDGTNIYKNYYNYEDKLQSTAINSDLNINTPYHYLNNIGKQINTVKSNYFINYSGKRAGISNDGKYIVLPVVSRAPIMSQDYGSTWYYLPGLSSITDFKYAVVSGNGQYMFIRKGSITYWSTNYGISWSLFTGVISTDNTNGIAVSYNGQYMVYAGLDSNNNSSIFISSNYGSTWTLTSAFTTSNTNFSATISTTGQYISVLSTNSYVLSSSDYGVTWVISYTNALLNCNQICMSSSGKYQTIVSSTSIFMSSNYGLNFTAVFTGAITPGFTSVTMIGSGEYQYAVNENKNQLYISSNYGANWYPVYTNRTSPSNTIISSDGKVMLYSASGDIHISRVADNAGSINSTAVSITHKGIVSALDLSVNGTITTNNLVVNEIYENGNLLGSKYATIDSPIFTGTVSGITSSMIGLSNVDNTSDVNKPISTAQQTALNLKANTASPTLTGTTTIQTANISNSLYVVGDVSMSSNLLVNGDVSFNGNLYANYASNTIPIDAIKGGIPSATGIFSYDISANLRLYVNGDVSFNSKMTVKNDTTLQNRLFVIQDTSMNANLYVAGNTILNNSVKTNSNLIVSGNSTLIGDVSMGGNLLVTGTIYEKGASLSSTYAGLYAPNITGTATFEKVVITDNFTVSTDSTINGNLTTNGNVSASILYEGGAALINKYATLASPTFTGTVSGITQSMVGLSNVNNTSDINKPISTAQQTAFDLKSNLESPTFTGTPLAPTPSTGTNTSQIATTAYVRGEIYSLIGSAPTTLNTLQELAEAINSDASFATTVTNQIALKAPLLNPTFTGTIITPDISITKGLYLTGDASMISRLYVGSDASFNANVYVGGSLTINSSFSTNGNFAVGGDLSVNGNITGNYPEHSIPSSAISNLRNQYGSFQISTQRADVVTFDDEHFELSRSSGDGAYVETIYAYDSDLSLNGNLYINGTGSSIFTNNVALESNLSVTNDALLNGNLYVGSNVILANDVSMNNNLDLSGSLIAHNNVNVYGIINQYTLSLEDGYKVDYTSYETTVESLKSQVETLQAQLATVLQILANNNLV